MVISIDVPKAFWEIQHPIMKKKKPLSKLRTELFKLILSTHTTQLATPRSPTLRNWMT